MAMSAVRVRKRIMFNGIREMKHTILPPAAKRTADRAMATTFGGASDPSVIPRCGEGDDQTMMCSTR